MLTILLVYNHKLVELFHFRSGIEEEYNQLCELLQNLSDQERDAKERDERAREEKVKKRKGKSSGRTPLEMRIEAMDEGMFCSENVKELDKCGILCFYIKRSYSAAKQFEKVRASTSSSTPKKQRLSQDVESDIVDVADDGEAIAEAESKVTETGPEKKGTYHMIFKTYK